MTGAAKPEDRSQLVAVLWHEGGNGDAKIVGVFESEAQARELVEHQHGQRLFETGFYHVTVRPLTKYRGDCRLWP